MFKVDKVLNLLNSNFYTDTTECCHIMKKYGSDKGLGWHNFTTFYDKIFNDIREQPIKIFELGLGSNNINLPSNMGADGKPGASLYGWSEYFNNKDTRIFGADIDKEILFKTDRITTYFTDQTNPQLINDMWNNVRDVEFDIIIDDGLHEFNGNYIFMANSIHKLKKGGLYIIEDLYPKTIDQFKHIDLCKQFNLELGIVITIPNNQNNYDNSLLIAIK